nr:dTDP-glucose 4,6-dehydratase [Thiolinea sp.]
PHRQLITHVADRPGHDRRYAINNSRISTELGYRPVETLASGLSRTLDWYLEHREFWENGDIALFGEHKEKA